MDNVIEQVAKAMFEATHGYHVDLNWSNAYEHHKDLYRKYARLVKPIFLNYFIDDASGMSEADE
jgi:hypothetical protein